MVKLVEERTCVAERRAPRQVRVVAGQVQDGKCGVLGRCICAHVGHGGSMHDERDVLYLAAQCNLASRHMRMAAICST